MLIRPATPADVPAVIPMVASLAALHQSWDNSRYDYRHDFQAMYDRWLKARAVDQNSVFLVADAGNHSLAGFLIATIEHTIPIYRLGQMGFIHDLWIEPQHRRRGLARRMTQMAVEKLRQMGIRQIRLETAVVNEAARRLFQSCGFRISSIEMLCELNQS